MKNFSLKCGAIIFALLLIGLTSCNVETAKNDPDAPVYPLIPMKVVDQESDTIITFDPATYQESMTVINYKNGQADTVQVY